MSTTEAIPPASTTAAPASGPPAAADTVTAVRARPIPVWKRTLDIVVSVALIVVAAPLFLLVALIVRIEGGPVFFTQRRLGQDGRIIHIRKFRTMAPDAEERLRSDPELFERYVANGFKLPPEEDPRLSRWGRLLRSSSLDELPQLLSVLRGDMSMVGPRPIVEPELVEYTSRGAHDAFLAARPGLTGLWQVSGRSSLSYDQRVALDLRYLARQSLLTDLKIVAKTAVVVVRRVGAH
jgi:lipopolysaccharide/colanic/teichoic acid biosynthesis glycosyltransferase